MDDFEAKIVGSAEVARGYFLLTMRLAENPGPVAPGQFVMVRIPGEGLFLRRPFSIYSAKGRTLSIMYKVVGKGTEVLCRMKTGQGLRVLGPLGKGFALREAPELLVVAGGIGYAGVRLLLSRLKGEVRLLYGCNSAAETAIAADREGVPMEVATVDGSAGYRGTVVELLAKRLAAGKVVGRAIFACGPEGMIRSLRGALGEERIDCQVSVEERMACGLGLCFGCVKPTLDEKDPYKRVCMEGPVFDIWELSL